MPVENVTANREYPKPFGGNDLSFDVLRIALALEGIDGDVAALLVALAGKAGFNSPTFTGVPQAPTAVLGTNSGQLATTAFVQAAVAALVSSAPGTLDTLNEIAAALGDDENFAATMAEALSLRLRIDAAMSLNDTQKLQGINNLGLFDRFPRHDANAVLGAPAIGRLLTNMGIGANVQSILGAADFAAVRGLLSQEVRIRQIKHLISGTGGSTSTTTSYGGTLGSGQTIVPVSNTSKLLVIGFGSGVVTRANTGLFGSMRLHRYNGSAWVASSLGSLNITLGENLGGTTSVDIRGPVVAIAIFPQADINAGTGNWQIVFAGNVSTTGSSPLLELNNISYLALELEDL